jgi:hypothetical protein
LQRSRVDGENNYRGQDRFEINHWGYGKKGLSTVRAKLEILCGFFATCTADHLGDLLMLAASLPLAKVGAPFSVKAKPWGKGDTDLGPRRGIPAGFAAGQCCRDICPAHQFAASCRHVDFFLIGEGKLRA